MWRSSLRAAKALPRPRLNARLLSAAAGGAALGLTLTTPAHADGEEKYAAGGFIAGVAAAYLVFAGPNMMHDKGLSELIKKVKAENPGACLRSPPSPRQPTTTRSD